MPPSITETSNAIVTLLHAMAPASDIVAQPENSVYVKVVNCSNGHICGFFVERNVELGLLVDKYAAIAGEKVKDLILLFKYKTVHGDDTAENVSRP